MERVKITSIRKQPCNDKPRYGHVPLGTMQPHSFSNWIWTCCQTKRYKRRTKKVTFNQSCSERTHLLTKAFNHLIDGLDEWRHFQAYAWCERVALISAWSMLKISAIFASVKPMQWKENEHDTVIVSYGYGTGSAREPGQSAWWKSRQLVFSKNQKPVKMSPCRTGGEACLRCHLTLGAKRNRRYPPSHCITEPAWRSFNTHCSTEQRQACPITLPESADVVRSRNHR